MKAILLASIALAFIVQAPAQPVIDNGGVVNATGYQSKLAPDTVFVIFGAAMGPASIVTANGPNYPDSLGGTSITFTPASGGAAVNARMIYTVAGQVAGLLPSSITPGTYSVQVTYNGQSSAPQTVTVVARSFGIATANSAGTGPAQATIGNVNGGLSLVRFTSGSVAFSGHNYKLEPAHPGDTLVLWGTGGGSDPANDSGGTSGDQTKAGKFAVNVGSRSITPLYAGASSGYPGLWQINFTLPSDIALDCFASLQVSAGGELSNAASLAIAAAGQSECSAPGFNQAILAKLDSGGGITFAGFSFGLVTSGSGFPTTDPGVTALVGGQFARYSAAEWLLPFSGPKFGPCSILDLTYPASGRDPTYPDAFLDAGASLPISGPGLAAGDALGTIGTATGPIYHFKPPAGTLGGGSYTLTGPGGTQVDPFSVSATLPTAFQVTNWSSLSTVDRSNPLTVTWTGTGFDQVIVHVQGATLGSVTHNVAVSCAVPASPGTFSIPASALAYLPAAGGPNTVGQLSVTTANAGGIVTAVSATVRTLTPNLVAGGQVDFGAFAPFLSAAKSVTIR